MASAGKNVLISYKTTFVTESVKDLPHHPKVVVSAHPWHPPEEGGEGLPARTDVPAEPCQSLQTAVTAAALSMSSDFPRQIWPGDGVWGKLL